MGECYLDRLKSHKVLSELSEIYYHNTGMIISFHYPGEDNRYDFYPQDQRSPFCKIIQATVEGARKCFEWNSSLIPVAYKYTIFEKEEL